MNFTLKALDSLFPPNMWLTYQGAECLPSYKYPGKCGIDLSMRNRDGEGLERAQGQVPGDSLKRVKQGSKGDCGHWGAQDTAAQWGPSTNTLCLHFPFCQLGTRTSLISGHHCKHRAVP